MQEEERNELLQKFAPIAASLSKKFRIPGMEPCDIEQECVLRTIEIIDEVGTGLTNAFLYSSLRNHLCNQYKRATFLATVSIDEPANQDEDDDRSLADTLIDTRTPSPEQYVIDNDLTNKVRKCVEALPTLEREIIVMHAGLDGHAPISFRSFATQRDLSPDLVERKFKRAIKAIRKEIL